MLLHLASPPMFMDYEIRANTLIGEFWGSYWASSLPLHLIILHFNNPFIYLAQNKNQFASTKA